MADTGVRTPPAPSALAAFKARVASLGSRPHRAVRPRQRSCCVRCGLGRASSAECHLRVGLRSQIAGGRRGSRTARGRHADDRRDLVPGQSDRGALSGEQPPGSAPSSRILPPIPGPADDDDAKDCHRYPVSVDWRRRDHSICGGTMEAPLQRRFATAAHSVHVDCGSR